MQVINASNKCYKINTEISEQFEFSELVYLDMISLGNQQVYEKAVFELQDNKTVYNSYNYALAMKLAKKCYSTAYKYNYRLDTKMLKEKIATNESNNDLQLVLTPQKLYITQNEKNLLTTNNNKKLLEVLIDYFCDYCF